MRCLYFSPTEHTKQQRSSNLGRVLEHCEPSPKTLAGLTTLDLSPLCDLLASDELAHRDFHRVVVDHDLVAVWNWLEVQISSDADETTDMFSLLTGVG